MTDPKDARVDPGGKSGRAEIARMGREAGRLARMLGELQGCIVEIAIERGDPRVTRQAQVLDCACQGLQDLSHVLCAWADCDAPVQGPPSAALSAARQTRTVSAADDGLEPVDLF